MSFFDIMQADAADIVTVQQPSKGWPNRQLLKTWTTKIRAFFLKSNALNIYHKHVVFHFSKWIDNDPEKVNILKTAEDI